MGPAIRRLSPYEELTIQFSENSVAVQTPWLMLDCEFNQAVDSIQKNVLVSLCQYPICYIHPQQIAFRNIGSLLRCAWSGFRCEGFSYFLGQRSASRQKVIAEAANQNNPSWNVNQVIRFSRIGWLNVCDGVAAFSVLRRYLHQSLLRTSEKKLFERLDHLKPQSESFSKGVAYVLVQNIYVTRFGTEALNRAVSRLPSIASKVVAYIESENGHDKLVLKSLRLMGYESASELEVLPETKQLVQILGDAAASSTLAFSLMIEFFEAGSSASRHPLASLLEGTVHAEAGRPLQMHRDINVNADHSSTALSFLMDSQPLTTREVHEASRLLALAVSVREAMLERLEDSLQRLAKTSDQAPKQLNFTNNC
jgi:hypothetical protein